MSATALIFAAALACNSDTGIRALDALYPTFQFASIARSQEVAGYEAKLATFRAKAAAVRDPCSRAGYLHWLDYFAKKLAARKADLAADERIRRAPLEPLK